MRLVQTLFLVLGMLLLGSYNTINSKLMYQTSCPTLPVGHHLFDKPWLTNLMMFNGEASLLLVFYLRQSSKRCRRNDDDLQESLLGLPEAPVYIFALPASCDVLGTGIAAVAMMFIDAAVWQMMRGAVIVFSAMFTVIFLKRQLRMYHWAGIFFTVLGLFLIGTSAILDEAATAKTSGNAHVGIALVILAQVFAAFQFTFEEHLLTGYAVSSLQTVGMEGVWGSAYMVVILAVMTTISGSDHGVYESIPDGLHMIRGSGVMQLLVSTYMASIAVYNFVGMQVCRKLSAVTRCLIDCMRTAVVWGFQLGLYYGVSREYGNGWTSHSWLQLVGFGMLVLGTLIYNGVIRLPAIDYRRLNLEFPRQIMQATWSPTVNRAATWGWGPQFGPHSPHNPESPQASPLAAPFGIVSSPDGANMGTCGDCDMTMQGMEDLPATASKA